ncbi:VF530 family DNA-binding protein (plasmid) [Pseudoalteromonas sp. T1lg65]|uniref:VF530 family protein n=1 Tax=Pseudoalteromonas sp. T1lg65 TaxID=2077101 RepID=UPI003F793B1B
MNNQPNNPLHGIKLEQILIDLEKQLGWKGMAEVVKINCFEKDPSIKSSLKFLRKTPWARAKVEQLYLDTFQGFKWPDS